jgi:hypothetical protein
MGRPHHTPHTYRLTPPPPPRTPQAYLTEQGEALRNAGGPDRPLSTAIKAFADSRRMNPAERNRLEYGEPPVAGTGLAAG